MIHHKFSETLNILYVAFTYGLGIPVLFPIACISFMMQWLSERFMIARYYPLPPAMTNELLKSFIAFAEIAPIILVMNGYLMMTNAEIFGN